MQLKEYIIVLIKSFVDERIKEGPQSREIMFSILGNEFVRKYYQKEPKEAFLLEVNVTVGPSMLHPLSLCRHMKIYYF